MKTAKERLTDALRMSVVDTMTFFNTSRLGLTEEQVEENRDLYGENELTKGQEDSIVKKIYESIINPFTVILLLIALVSLVTNVWLAKPGQEDPTTFIIIVVLEEQDSVEDFGLLLSLFCCLVVFALCKNCGVTKLPAIFHA